MYAPPTIHSIQTTSADARPPVPSRATLKTRPQIQRSLIRSWEYRRPVRITVLIIRLLVVMWLSVLTVILTANGYAAGWALVPAAIGVFAFALWVNNTAATGWPVDKA
jgi:hypothetical protein